MEHKDYVAAYRVAAKAATEKGFTHVKGKGYWKAVRAFCESHKISLPTRERKAAAVKVTKRAATTLIVDSSETPRERKNRLERERRARIKAGK